MWEQVFEITSKSTNNKAVDLWKMSFIFADKVILKTCSHTGLDRPHLVYVKVLRHGAEKYAVTCM